MATSTAVKTEQPGQIDLSALKTKQHGAWSSGDYAIVGTTLQIVGEELCEALDLRAGQKVLDVAAGNGNATLAAARRWCEVISTDYVPSLLERGRARAAAEGLPVAVQGSGCRGAALRRRDVRRRALDLRRDVHARPGPAAAEIAARVQERRQDRPRQLDAGGLHRPAVQDARQIPAAAGRREIAGAVGNAGAHHGVVRRGRPPRSRPSGALHVPLPFAEHLLDMFRNYYGPMLKAFAALDETNQRRLADDILALIASMNRAEDGTMVVPSEYLEIVIAKR